MPAICQKLVHIVLQQWLGYLSSVDQTINQWNLLNWVEMQRTGVNYETQYFVRDARYCAEVPNSIKYLNRNDFACRIFDG